MNEDNRQRTGGADPITDGQPSAQDIKPSKRFRRGQSGNPNGRPKDARNRKTIVSEVARESHVVVENGRKVRRSTFDLVLLTIQALAMDGRSRHFRKYIELIEKHDRCGGQETGGYIIVPEFGPHWNEMLKEQQDWLQDYVRRLSEGRADLSEKFVSKYEPPRLKPKKPV